jgi:exodeoxyribonuclease VII large subunit
VWSVSELVDGLNALLRSEFSGLWLEGEVTNASRSGRGHLYCSLKDDRARIDCVMWARRASRLRFELEDGLAVLVQGSLTVWGPGGRLQIVLDEVEPRGTGALQLAFEQLKARLAAEGLFAEDRKRPLPALPQRVGVVTSPTGAAVRDMLKVLLRFDHLHVVLAPARVQGEGAADELAAQVSRLAASGLVDVLIVGRGGGSLEDLWAFNEEVLARAIAACPVPVISGVGHQVDVSIADFVADVRATTPTQAAEMIVSRLEEQLRRLDQAERSVHRDMLRHLELARARLRGAEGSSGLARLPQRLRLLRSRLDRASQLAPAVRRLVARVHERLAAAETSLQQTPRRVAAGGHRRVLAATTAQLRHLMRARLQRSTAVLTARERELEHLSPRGVLKRGYSMTTVAGTAEPIRDAARLRAGEVLETTFARGTVRSVVGQGGANGLRRGRGAAASNAVQAGLFAEDDEV